MNSAIVNADRLERAATLLGEAGPDSKHVAAELNLARDAIETAAEASSARAVAWQLDDAIHHLRNAEALSETDTVLVPVRNARQLVAAARGGGLCV